MSNDALTKEISMTHAQTTDDSRPTTRFRVGHWNLVTPWTLDIGQWTFATVIGHSQPVIEH